MCQQGNILTPFVTNTFREHNGIKWTDIMAEMNFSQFFVKTLVNRPVKDALNEMCIYFSLCIIITNWTCSHGAMLSQDKNKY